MDQEIVKIRQGELFITLNILLKITGEISTGGQAKYFLHTTKVLVNGEEENRRGRKLYPGDEVVVGNTRYLIQ